MIFIAGGINYLAPSPLFILLIFYILYLLCLAIKTVPQYF
jgi:hypothetical protein